MNCAFTGHRNFDYYNEIRSLERAVESAIINDDVDTFYNGMARGFDLAAAQTVIQLKRRYKIKLIACVPFYGQKETLNAFDRKIYEEVLEHCNEIIVLSQDYYPGCMYKRNRYMVNNCDMVIAYYRGKRGGTQYTVKYAEEQQKKIVYI